MPVTYRQIAGASMERLAALSDGIFAVAMTLLVLGLSVQSASALHSPTNAQVWDHVLRPLWPHLVTYLMSFLTLGVFWVGQQTQLNHTRGSNRDFTWIHLAFLLCVVLMPFSTTLVSDYITTQLAIVVYWVNIALLGAILYAGQRYARRARLLKDHITAATVAALERRIIVYQALYAVGALLSVASTYASIAFIIAVQLNAAITPRFWILDRF
ncbi:MAG TPA: TMEM175 family protein [Streptosporangiaceae bacterium]